MVRRIKSNNICIKHNINSYTQIIQINIVILAISIVLYILSIYGFTFNFMHVLH